MICRNPFTRGMHAYPCGSCMPCRINRRRMWTHRIMLESMQKEDNAFITLTYDDAKYDNDNLNRKHLTDWLKRIRFHCRPETLRYYAVGEYGDVNNRPHYHLALFGFPHCRNGQTNYNRKNVLKCCDTCKLVAETWGYGRIDNGELTPKRAAYVAGYVTKKMTHREDPRLNGREPEFGTMSLRPGIGADALHEFANVLLRYDLERELPDVPSNLRHAAKEMPLGRYLRGKLRALVGRDEACPQEVLDAMAAQVFDVYMAAYNSKTQPSFKKALIAAGHQRSLQLDARERIHKSRRVL